MEKAAVNPMQSAHAAPRCKAKSKRSGKRCNAPAVRECSVCRMHGAGGGSPSGSSHGRYQHGRFTAEAVRTRQEVRELIRAADAGIAAVW